MERNRRFEQARRGALADLKSGLEFGLDWGGRPASSGALHER